ncbi:hypothetical protein [Candidatus Nitrospira allomarina]|uniref:Lipoprotein n=1 Tax=Candidatus Nitrospira allomarina TaxID=3020900 RepID=A0AA96JW61_9BACT|nr:hypothetical protein [Candidatus Nitrospira allomarina]WNM57541.1 hypothetical protein PP769_16450 [Candidatus Nitrospira allomarina]
MMNPYRRGQACLGRLGLTFTIFCAVGIFACASQDFLLTGSWESTEITHPSPFFSGALASNTGRNVSLILNRHGTFTWVEPEGVCHSGVYRIQGQALLLIPSPEKERIRLDYTFRGDELRLKTPDGFMFEFRKTPHQVDAGAKPCN